MKWTNKKLSKVIVDVHGLKPHQRVEFLKDKFPLFFVYYFPEVISEGYKFADFHFDIFKDLEDLTQGEINELALILFRESAKTTIARAFVIFCICYKIKKYINFDSYEKNNAEQALFDIVTQLQTNEKLVKDFGQLYNAPRDKNKVQQKRVSNFVTNNDIKVEAFSTQESTRGRLYNRFRPDLFILDDIENYTTRESRAITDKVIAHVNEMKAGLGVNGSIIYIGNYITEYGSIASIISNPHSKFRVRMIPVIKDEKPVWPDKYVMTDEELTAGKVSLETKRRQLGSQTFNTEMMNMPIDDSVAEFKVEWFKLIEWRDVELMETTCYITIDTAVSEKASADNTGIAINFVNQENKWHIKSYKLKINPTELINLIFKFYEDYHPAKIGVEKTIYLQAIKPFLEDEMRRRNVFPLIQELDHRQTAKESRIRLLIPRYESGSIYHINGECRDLEEELRTFPVGQHDDVIDALAYQPQIVVPNTNEEYEEIENLYGYNY